MDGQEEYNINLWNTPSYIVILKPLPNYNHISVHIIISHFKNMEIILHEKSKEGEGQRGDSASSLSASRGCYGNPGPPGAAPLAAGRRGWCHCPSLRPPTQRRRRRRDGEEEGPGGQAAPPPLSPVCPAKRAKATQQLPLDDDSQDFQPEKPPSKSKVRGRRGARPAVCPIPGIIVPVDRNHQRPGGEENASPSRRKVANRQFGGQRGRMEEVEELQNVVPEEPSVCPVPQPTLAPKPLVIEIESAAHGKKRERREKRQAQFEDYLRRMINRFTRNLRVDIHKVHLLCLLANGMFRNRMCNEPELWAMALSLIPANLAMVPGGDVEIPYISKLLKWFVSTFDIDPSLPSDEMDSLLTVLKRRFGSHSARNEQEMVQCVFAVLNLVPALKLAFCFLLKNPRGSKSTDLLQQTRIPALDAKPEPASQSGTKGDMEVKLEGGQDGSMKTLTAGEEKPQPVPKRKQVEHVNRRGYNRGRLKKVEGASAESGFEDEECLVSKRPGSPRPKNDRRRRVASKVSYKEETSEDDDDSDSDFEVLDSSGSSNYSDGDNRSASWRKRVFSQTNTPQGRPTDQGNNKGIIFSTPKSEKDSEDDFESDPGKINPSKRRSSKCNKTKANTRRERTRLVSEVSPNSKGSDQWIEVYAEAEKKWVAVDCVRNTLSHPELCAKHASKPLSYIISFDNESCVRDVTQRYDVAWMTRTRKQRVDPGWWDKTLAVYKSNCTERQKEEDLELQSKLLDQPLPTSVAEYKNHPLYVLKRHLLKYETLHPPTATILGYCRTEAVYSRECVRTLHSKDTWMKEARVVRDGEVPCKMVKSQSNQARRARQASLEDRDKDDLGLYGHWQTEVYSPPRAINGKVPRNDFGNVYLFKPCMLPVGCKHLRESNINRVARKLNIDCAGAVIGFDFHSGHSHPITDGYIVCEEYVEILLAAREEEEAEMARKEQKKREQRVMGNWKLLVKGLLIRERLKARYGGKDEAALSSSQEGGMGCSVEQERRSGSVPVSDLTSSWPLNRQEAGAKEKLKSQRQKKGQEKHLFPFEKL
ncbi:DNA repair protein complementing XP-C cells [Scyliorhinus canicula]|uniref:DNA repair protein complementing XP-C cells n=1 Tax=Scyliorhinus canicula TaxID=7830 RepID=UPI0018F60CE6|nr:DNA repair protein complementing XP-C cells [Scyliorhinus canicula]